MKGKYLLLMIFFVIVLIEALTSFVSISKAAMYPDVPAFRGGFEPADIFSEPFGHLYDIHFKHSDWTRRSEEVRPMETCWTIAPGHEGYIDLEIIKVSLAGDANYICIDGYPLVRNLA